MKSETFAVLTILAGLFIGGAFTDAAAIPGIPHQFFGSVNFLNGPAQDNILIEAKLDGSTIASTTTSNGMYGSAPNLFLITDPGSNMAGKNISFYVSGDFVASAAFDNGRHTKLDFFVNKNLANSSTSQSNDVVNINENKDGEKEEVPVGTKTLTFLDNVSLIKININLKRAIVNPSLSVTLLSEAPVDEPQQQVYQYLNIIEKSFTNADIDSATVEFRVSKSWIADNDVTRIVLLRYDNGWNELATELTNSTDEYNIYTAHTDAFSYLAIAGEKPEIEEQLPVKTEEQDTKSTPQTMPTGSFLGNIASTTWVGIILLLIVIILYGYRTREKRKEDM